LWRGFSDAACADDSRRAARAASTRLRYSAKSSRGEPCAANSGRDASFLPYPKFSILLVVKNALPMIRGALDSLKQQSFRDFEVIVTDGASTDGTLAVLEEWAKRLPLRIVSEPDRSLADGFAKALRRASGDVVGFLCADERYYPNTLEQALRWFEAERKAVMCGGKVDFLDEYDKIVDRHLTAPFNLPAHLACELVPSNLTSFFNRRLIGDDFYYESSVPTCPDYEFWARLGFRFPQSAFIRHDVSIGQAYRTRDSMSFRAESFRQLCHDKLVHLNNLVAKGYVKSDVDAICGRASAGIHMWAAEQLRYIQHDHPDISAYCAAAARYDKSYDRIAHLITASGRERYDPLTGSVNRTVTDNPGSQSSVVGQFEEIVFHPNWIGTAVLSMVPLTVRTSSGAWGFALELPLPDNFRSGQQEGGQYWARLDVQTIEGSAGIGLLSKDENFIGEQIIREGDGRTEVLIPLPSDLTTSLILRSGGVPSSVVRIHRAQVLFDPERGSGAIMPIELALVSPSR
jgi:glycosyltransferase involved in cell wall biosynthesis